MTTSSSWSLYVSGENCWILSDQNQPGQNRSRSFTLNSNISERFFSLSLVVVAGYYAIETGHLLNFFSTVSTGVKFELKYNYMNKIIWKAKFIKIWSDRSGEELRSSTLKLNKEGKISPRFRGFVLLFVHTQTLRFSYNWKLLAVVIGRRLTVDTYLSALRSRAIQDPRVFLENSGSDPCNDWSRRRRSGYLSCRWCSWNDQRSWWRGHSVLPLFKKDPKRK